MRLLLLSHSVELQKANLQEANNASNGNGSSSTTSSSTISASTPPNPLASAIPLAQLLAKPGALNALTSLTALGGLSDLLGGLANIGPPVQTTGVHRNKNFRSPNSNTNNDNNKKGDRNKFNPY